MKQKTSEVFRASGTDHRLPGAGYPVAYVARRTTLELSEMFVGKLKLRAARRNKLFNSWTAGTVVHTVPTDN
jgi:hypothetical protein